METVFGLTLMLIAVSHGVDTSCDGRQEGARCFGALGGTVFIQLMNNASEIYKFKWMKDKQTFLRIRNNEIRRDIFANRFLFNFDNGTFRINQLSRNDSGEYKLEMFKLDGLNAGTRTLQLSVQAPVSSVQLVPQCLSQGQMKVSCSSEGGDSPQYSWTLDGHTLTDSELLSGNNESNIIILRQTVSGRLICSVRNHVSNLSKDAHISTCGFIFINCTSNGTHISEWVFETNNSLCVEPAAGPHKTVGSSSLLICGVLIVICLFFAWKKNTFEKVQSSADPHINITEEQENAVIMAEPRSSAL